MFDEAEKARQAERKDIGTANPNPNPLQRRDAVEIRGAGEISGIDRADRSADHKIREHARSQQDPHHADLYGAETAPAGKDECRFSSGRSHKECPTKGIGRVSEPQVPGAHALEHGRPDGIG
jgi:hypothetical protein